MANKTKQERDILVKRHGEISQFKMFNPNSKKINFFKLAFISLG